MNFLSSLTSLFTLVLKVVLASFLFGCGPSVQRHHIQAQRLYAEGRYREAATVLRPLSSNLAHLPDSTAWLLADVWFAHGEVKRAAPLLRRLATADTANTLRALRLLAHTHYFLGNPDSATAYANELFIRAQQRHDTLRLSQAHHLLGLVAFFQAAYDDAQTHQQQSLTWARVANDPLAEADALRQIGVLHWYRGQLDEALTEGYLPALERYRAAHHPIGEATTLSNIGLLHAAQGAPEINLRYQLEAFDLRVQMGDQIGLSDSYLFLGSDPFVRHPAARFAQHSFSFIQKSLTLSTQIGYAWGREVAARALGGLMAHQTDYASLSTWASWADSVHTLSGEGYAHLRLQAATRAVFEHRWQDALSLLQEAEVWIDSLHIPSMKYQTLAWQIVPLRKLGQDVHARRVLHKARELNPTDLRLMGALAEWHLDQGHPDSARALLEPLVATQDSVYLHHLHRPSTSFSFERAAGAVHLLRSDLYHPLIRAAALQNDLEAVFRFIEQERDLPFWGNPEAAESDEAHKAVRTFAERLQSYEASPPAEKDLDGLLNAMGQMHRALVPSPQALLAPALSFERRSISNLPTLQAALATDEALIAYVVGRSSDVVFPHHNEETLQVLVVRPDTVVFQTLPQTATDVESVVSIFQQTLARGRDDPMDQRWRSPAATLYATLLLPLMEQGLLEPQTRLIFLPHRFLHQVPFHALPTTLDGPPRFVIQDHTVSYLPAATALVSARQQPPAPFHSVGGFAPDQATLPYSKEEVESIPGTLFPDRTLLLGGDATVDSFFGALSRFTALHIAAHARTRPAFPLHSTIEFAHRPLALHEVMHATVSARLVVLSACDGGYTQGAFDDEITSESLVSFPRAFLEAGARSVLASHWLVEDQAAATLMQSFYHRLATPCPSSALCGVAESLAHAQRDALAAPEAQRHHPYYWAGFYLMGDSR